MAFFHAQASIIQPIQPHHGHSHPAGGSAINDELEVETAALIAKLAHDDLMDFRKGKGRADSLPSSDGEIAYQLQIEQYYQWLSVVADAQLAKSIDGTDDAYLDAFINAEEAAAGDCIAAELLFRDGLSVPWMDSDVTVVTQSQCNHSNAAGKRSITGPSANCNERVDCIICHESCRYFEMLKTPCEHYYCKSCLVTLVDAFTRDESLFPLRCCQEPIPVAEILPILPLALCFLFEQKIAEFSVLARDRLYCSNPDCSTFLGSSEGQLSLSAIGCPYCLVDTCPQCKESAHPGEGCGVSTSNDALHALALSQEWQTCPGCNAVVELNLGCYHMTCRCKTQFCYLCAAVWKTCDCVQWEEDPAVQQGE